MHNFACDNSGGRGNIFGYLKKSVWNFLAKHCLKFSSIMNLYMCQKFKVGHGNSFKALLVTKRIFGQNESTIFSDFGSNFNIWAIIKLKQNFFFEHNDYCRY